jgi:hypothetical protein
MIIVRHADDLVVGFEHAADARRFWDAMRTRFEQFGLELHAEKARLLEFGRFAAERRRRRGAGRPETFKSLGFTLAGHAGGLRGHCRVAWQKGQTKQRFSGAQLHDNQFNEETLRYIDWRYRL